MGNRGSSNNCCAEKDSCNSQLNAGRSMLGQCQTDSARTAAQLNQLQMNYNNLLTSYNILKERAMNTADTKDKAKQLFDHLAGQLIDRIDLTKTQTELLAKQSNIITDSDKKIQKSSKELDDVKTDLHTRKRVLHYDERDDDTNRLAIFLMRMVVLLIGIIVILVLIKKLLNL